MKLRVVTPESVLFEADDITGVFAKSVDGEVGILPKHIPMVTPLAAGTLRYEQAGQKHPIQLSSGLLHTDGETVSVLANP